jgi:hypothetical protein
MVSIFKDFLITDDINEFLRRSYTREEQHNRIPLFCNYYKDVKSNFTPNYISMLPEAKYMYKNLDKKMRLIEEKQKHLNKS